MGDDSWYKRSACRTIYPDPKDRVRLFFPAADDPVSIAKARSICYTECSVRNECLAYAYANRTKDGIWGGIFFERTISKSRRHCPRCGEEDLIPWGNKIECGKCRFSWTR